MQHKHARRRSSVDPARFTQAAGKQDSNLPPPWRRTTWAQWETSAYPGKTCKQVFAVSGTGFNRSKVFASKMFLTEAVRTNGSSRLVFLN